MMQHTKSLWALAVCLLVALVMLWMTPTAWAGAKEEVAAAARKWAETIGAADPDAMIKLYAKDAVFWGTSSRTVRQDPEAVREYFVGAAKRIPGLKMTFEEPMLIRIYGDIAINTGIYTATFVRGGETRTPPLRYSFTYIKRGGEWKIINHHSSRMPKPRPTPKAQK